MFLLPPVEHQICFLQLPYIDGDWHMRTSDIGKFYILLAYFYRDDSIIRRFLLKRGVCLTVQSAVCPLLVYKYMI